MTTLSALARARPPPASPPSALDWSQVETELRTRLPEDYRQLMATYGPGEFCDFLSLHYPHAPREAADLTGPMPARLRQQIEEVRHNARQPWPLPHPPEQLFAMGVTGNGDYIFWVTQPSDRPDAWDVAVNQALRAPWYTFAGTLTEFLLAGVELGGIGGGEAPDHDSVRYVGSSGRRRGLEVEHSLVGAHVVERLGQQRQKAFRGFDAVVREWGQFRRGKGRGVTRQGGAPVAGDGDGTGPGRVVAPRPPGSCGEDVLHQRGGPWGAGQEQRLTGWGERDCARGHANSGDVRVKQVRPRGGGRTWCQR
ncbi:SMI1/KNR4 family protein [Streptomyces rubiginosohelvolus]|uniref:SMI1/KNR4 family protein n=2 Tax=Streptomyces rubiginosohelvolus TaxID=67362 RepID=UPI0035D6DC60